MSRIILSAASAAFLLLGAGSAAAVPGPGNGPDGQSERGICNAIIAGGLGAAHQFVQGVGDPAQQCTEVGETLEAFLQTEGCLDAFLAGELPGLGGGATSHAHGPRAGELTPLGEVICGALCGCGFFPNLPGEICGGFDCP